MDAEMVNREAILQRLEDMERLSRRWRIGALVLAVSLPLVGPIAVGYSVERLRTFVRENVPPAPPASSISPSQPAVSPPQPSIGDSIDTKRIRLVDRNGQSRLTMGTIEDEPFIVLQGASGKLRAMLTMRADEPQLIMYSKHDENCLALTIEDGSPVVRLGVHGKLPSLVLTATKEQAAIMAGLPSTTTRPSAGNILLLADEDRTALGFSDGHGVIRAQLGMKDGGPYLSILDERGKERATLGAGSTVHKDDGTVTTHAESTILLFNKEGTLTWKAPP